MAPGKNKQAASQQTIPSCFTETHGVIVSTMNDLPGYKVTEIYGTVYGLTVRARNWGTDIAGALRTSVGGEIRVFTNMMYTARDEAVERLIGECLGRGGNAIIALRFDQSAFGACSQVCAYGTACRVEKVEHSHSTTTADQ